jgi:hypothetical protein
MKLPIRLTTAPARGTTKYTCMGKDVMKNLIEGRNSIIFMLVNEYIPNMARELIMPPRIPITKPSIMNGSLIKVLVEPNNLSVSISSFLL